MSQLRIIRPHDTATDIRGELTRALERSDECDSVLILMEKRSGGILWFANDTSTLAKMNWLVSSMNYHIHAELAGNP